MKPDTPHNTALSTATTPPNVRHRRIVSLEGGSTFWPFAKSATVRSSRPRVCTT